MLIRQSFQPQYNVLGKSLKSTNGAERENKMKPKTRDALLKAYAQLHQIIEDLYQAHDDAVANMMMMTLAYWLVEPIDFI
jgi:hypothetical protein